MSVITELELLSYPDLSTAEENAIKAFLSDVVRVGLNAEIRDAAVLLRREQRLKLPDAIICATAKVLGAELLTNDARLCSIPDIQSSPVKVKTE